MATTKGKKPVTAPKMSATEESTSKSKAYTKAIGQLREKYRDEFDELLDAAYGEFGLTVKRRPSPAEVEERRRLHAEGVAQRKQARIDAKNAKIQAAKDEKRRKLEAELAALDDTPADGDTAAEDGDPRF